MEKVKKMKKIKKEIVIEALYRLQENLIQYVKEEYPNESYPLEFDDRIGEIYNTIDLLEDMEEEKI